MALFNPPLPKSTFHDRVKRGEFASSKVPGHYLLNATRKKLGMPLVDAKAYRAKLAQADESERARQLLHAALAVTVPEAIEAGLPLTLPSAMTLSEGETVLSKHKAFFSELERYHLESRDGRIGFVAGALKVITSDV
ncbi:MAG: hypothetical protein Q7Q73_17400 [Verrucomicrobiota bacterium JB024]|nr:hypothetical protein [Verrucomicrobiota bacterium JB024]